MRHEVRVGGVRRLSALLDGLPPDSALHRSYGEWTLERELQALAIDRADMWSRLWVGMNVKRSDQSKLPHAIEIVHPDRPEPPKKQAASISDVTRMFR